MDTPGNERRNVVEEEVEKLKEKMDTIVKIWKDQIDMKNHLMSYVGAHTPSQPVDHITWQTDQEKREIWQRMEELES